MLSIDIVCIGKLKETYLKEAVAEYTKRLSKYCHIQVIELADEKLPVKLNTSLIAEIKQKEASRMLEHMKKDSYIICLDLKRKRIFQ